MKKPGAGKPKADKKSEVESPKSEEENNSLPAGQAGAIGILHSEINEPQINIRYYYFYTNEYAT